MATKIVVQELITKWKYKIDSTQIKKTARAIKGLKRNFTDVRRSSVAFGKGEFTRIRRIRSGWQGLNKQVIGYRKNLTKASMAGGGLAAAGGMAGGRGKGTGKARFGQSGAFLAGRALGSSAITSALLGGPALAGLFGGGMALRQAGKREQAEIGFTGLLGGKGKGEGRAKEMMDAINKFAVESPFQISDLRNLSREALGGGFKQEEAIPLLSMLGDATQGRLPELRRMLTNMVEIRNTQRASLRDIRQFGRAGVPIYEALNKTLGVSGLELGKMISAGKIGLKEVTAALKLLTGAGGKFNNLMKDQMSGLMGKVSNLGDVFEVLGEKMGKPLLGVAKGALDGLMEMLQGATPHAENIMEAFAGIVKGVKWLFEYFPNLSSYFKIAGVAIGFMLLPFKAIALVVAGIYLIVDDIMTGLKGGRSITKYIMDGAKWLYNIDWSGKFVQGITFIKEAFQALGDWMANTALGQAVMSGLSIVGSKLEGATSGSPMALPAGYGYRATGLGGGGGVDVGGVNNAVTVHIDDKKQLDNVLSTSLGNAWDSTKAALGTVFMTR